MRLISIFWHRFLMTVVFISLVDIAGAALPSWDFSSGLQGWSTIGGDLTSVTVTGGVVEMDAVGPDPIFYNPSMSFAATAWQYVLTRIKANQGGTLQLFWSGTFEGPYSGISQEKSTLLSLPGDNQWHDVIFHPGWQTESAILQMRFDVYGNAHFSLDSIEVHDWAKGRAPLTNVYSWTLNDNLSSWTIDSRVKEIFAPPLTLPLFNRGYVYIRARAQSAQTAAILWTTDAIRGLQRKEFDLIGDGQYHSYFIDMQGTSGWWGNLLVLGLDWPRNSNTHLDSVALTTAPIGPSDLVVDYFGFENAINRPGKNCRLLTHLFNRGGNTTTSIALRLSLPAGLQASDGITTKLLSRKINNGEVAEAIWNVTATKAGATTATLGFHLTGTSTLTTATAALRFDPTLTLPRADYVPPPNPVETTVPICTYYFPGWNSYVAWDPLRWIAPIRKPLLGYYNEANPECVDWQIKWARENGISCFLLDWYWVQGNQFLDHWLKAYRKARYRDQLKIAIMWANHYTNCTNRQDWRNATQYWIDNIFPLTGYLKVNGKPAVFLWDPDQLRADMGSSAEVKAALTDSQDIATSAGYPGIAFITVKQ